jgi:acyl-CoA synthetase (AMP-forming)/AMP-acid ligase II
MTGQNRIETSIQTSAGSIATVGALFRACATLHTGSIVLEYRGRHITYAELLDRVHRATAVLAAQGLQRGDRVALLSRNRPEYFEIELAAANLGAITTCLNWRLSPRELAYCVDLVSPKLLIVEPDLALNLTSGNERAKIEIGEQYEQLMARQDGRSAPIVAQPEDGLVILYTSGTTGLPKGAVVSHRAMIMRALVFTSELGIATSEAFVAWAPLFHMASTDHGLATLLRGGTVVIIDGFQVEPLLGAIAAHRIGWLVLIPGMVEALVDGMRTQRTIAKGVRVCGAMADLVPPHSIAAATELLQAPYLNSFGSTETGLPPASRALISIGEVPTRLSKRAELVLRGEAGRPVRQRRADGNAGRARHPRRYGVLRLLAGRGGQCVRFPRRLVPHGRRFPAQRRRLARFRRPRQIHDQERRRKRLSGGNRTRPAGRQAYYGSCGRARARHEMGRGAGCLHFMSRWQRDRSGT